MAIEKQLLERIRSNDPSLTFVDLSNDGICDKDVETLIEALQSNTHLKSLNLSSNKLSWQAADYFGEYLKTNQSLESLDLSKNNLVKYFVMDKWGNFSYSNYSKKSSKATNISGHILADGLRRNFTLQSLNLGKTNIGNSGASTIAYALTTNSNLKFLGLHTNLTSESRSSVIKDLAEMLKANSSLERLDLSNNYIGDVASLAEALKTNLALKEINFQSCTIGDQNKSLADMLAINSTLQQMNFELTKIGFEAKQAMLLALDSNYSLLKLELPELLEQKKKNFERNQAIVDCFKILHSEDPLRAGAQEVLTLISCLESLVPELICEKKNLADNHFIAEQYRLLHALGYMLSFNGHREALHYLLPPFEHPFTKRFAEWAIAHQLLYSARADFKETCIEQQTLRWGLILYGMRHELHKEEIASIAYTALYRLIFQKKEEGIGPIRNLQQDIALLTHSDVLRIASKALGRLNSVKSLESRLLNMLVVYRIYNPQIIKLLYQSREFIEELRRQDSKKLTFMVIEDVFVNPVKEIPKIDFEPLTQEQLNSISSCKNSQDESFALMIAKLEQHIIRQENISMALRQFYLFTYKEPYELTTRVVSQKEVHSCTIF